MLIPCALILARLRPDNLSRIFVIWSRDQAYLVYPSENINEYTTKFAKLGGSLSLASYANLPSN